MKMWEAELNLFNEDFGKGKVYKINFSFEFNGEDYELNESQTKYLNVYGMFYKRSVARTPFTLVMGWIANILNKLKLMLY